MLLSEEVFKINVQSDLDLLIETAASILIQLLTVVRSVRRSNQLLTELSINCAREELLLRSNVSLNDILRVD
jgi:hypothetical protein